MPDKIRKERLEFKINRCTNKQWDFYKKYHYLTESLPAGHYYEIKLKDKKVGFICINRFPHPKTKDIMVISRLVIVPEFQGFGIGVKFTKQIANLYSKQNRIRITTSLKSFIKSLKNDKDFVCVRYGRVGSGSGSIHNKKNTKSFSFARITATFELKK